MKLEKYALFAEIISSIAVIVTLVVLIVEVRGNIFVPPAIRNVTWNSRCGSVERSWSFSKMGEVSENTGP